MWSYLSSTMEAFWHEVFIAIILQYALPISHLQTKLFRENKVLITCLLNCSVTRIMGINMLPGNIYIQPNNVANFSFRCQSELKLCLINKGIYPWDIHVRGTAFFFFNPLLNKSDPCLTVLVVYYVFFPMLFNVEIHIHNQIIDHFQILVLQLVFYQELFCCCSASGDGCLAYTGTWPMPMLLQHTQKAPQKCLGCLV